MIAFVLSVLVLAALLSSPVHAGSRERVSSDDAGSGSAGAAEAQEGADLDPEDPDAETIATLQTHVEALSGEVEALRELVTDLAAQVARTRPALHNYRIPDAITFAGKPVPLDRWDVAERLEREFYLALAQPAQVIFWLKRSARYFPYIEEKLRAAGLPEDLKYVAVVESDLRPRAYSWAHASGIWQFIADTGRRYGLRVTASWDERRDPERSTAAAIAYLKDLYDRFDDWPLALAAYNAGEIRVQTALKQQGISEYYQVALPVETERYLFRILAAKVILEDPGQHGFEVAPDERYSPRPTDTVALRVVGSLRIREIAAAAGSFYREIKALNPAIMRDVLPEGRYDVQVPKGLGVELTAKLPTLERSMAPRAVRRVEYRVKDGDTLAGIARRFGVSVDGLKKRNRSARGPHIYPGDLMIIERAR